VTCYLWNLPANLLCSCKLLQGLLWFEECLVLCKGVLSVLLVWSWSEDSVESSIRAWFS
jgi:hypothetical protein